MIARQRLALFALALAGCGHRGLELEPGLIEQQSRERRELSINPTLVPMIDACADGAALGREAGGWSCQTDRVPAARIDQLGRAVRSIGSGTTALASAEVQQSARADAASRAHWIPSVACAADPAMLARVRRSADRLELRGAGRLEAHCMVVPRPGAERFQRLLVRYRDPDGAGAAIAVHLELSANDALGGLDPAPIAGAVFDSSNYADRGPAEHEVRFNHHPDFALFNYDLTLILTASSSTATSGPWLSAVRID